MGIIDKVSALLPWRHERREPSRTDVLSLRDGLDRWFERFIDEAERTAWSAPGVTAVENRIQITL